MVVFRNTIEKHQEYGILIGLHVDNCLYNGYSQQGEITSICFDILYILKHFDRFRRDALPEANKNKSQGTFWVDIYDTRYMLADSDFQEYVMLLQEKGHRDGSSLHYVLYQDYEHVALPQVLSKNSKQKLKIESNDIFKENGQLVKRNNQGEESVQDGQFVASPNKGGIISSKEALKVAIEPIIALAKQGGIQDDDVQKLNNLIDNSKFNKLQNLPDNGPKKE